MRTLAFALSLLVLAGCSNPGTMPRVQSAGAPPTVIDARTGVVAVIEITPSGAYETSLRRIDGDSYTTLTPPIPADPASPIAVVSWLDGEALAGDSLGHLFHFAAGAWETLSLAACDPTLPNVALLDAPRRDDAWVVASGTSEATLCHWNGVTFDATESLDFVPSRLVESGDALVATDASGGRVMRRASPGAAWTMVWGIEAGDASFGALVPHGDEVFLEGLVEAAPSTWWRVSQVAASPVDGIPGWDGERWRIDERLQTHQQCSSSWFDGHTICDTFVDVTEEHVMRIDGATPVEVGFLRFDQGGARTFTAMAIAPGRLLLSDASGASYVTAE